MARRTFFSFHYVPDVWRAWNVRKSWEFLPGEQNTEGFFDGSVFEASKRESDESLKRFLRTGLKNTSVTCVLAGTQTAKRRWVRYEIAQSVLKGNGLVTVDIHRIANQDGATSEQGPDPLSHMGVYRTATGIYLAEWSMTRKEWIKYEDYSLPVDESVLWFPAPKANAVVRLSDYCNRYDFVQDNGRVNIGEWIEEAANLAGR